MSEKIIKIDKNKINFDKVYGRSQDALSDNGKTVRAREEYWGDNNQDLYLDLETGMVIEGSEDGVGLGFINPNDINKSVLSNDNSQFVKKEVLANDNSQFMYGDKKEVLANDNSQFKNGSKIETIKGIDPKNDYSNYNGSEHNPDAGINTNTDSRFISEYAKPEDFNYELPDSNKMAAMARNMGFTDEQIKIAISISRHETGNYDHLAGGYNYGGVSGSGDLGYSIFYDKNGNPHKYAKYSSKDVGMNAYLQNLKKNYFDIGLDSVESIARKYLGYDNTSNWIRSVKSNMKQNK